MALLEIDNLAVEFETASGPVPRGRRRVDLVSTGARCWRSSANPAPASRWRCWPSWACCRGPPRSPPTAWPSTAPISSTLSPRERRKIIGKDMAMIFQEPMASLNPCFTVGFQIEEALKRPSGHGPGAAPRPRHRAADAGRHSGAGRAARHLPAPDVGRPVPARDDRHGDRLQSEAADRRRADHRARRDHPGADPRPAAAAAGRDRHGR